MPILSIQHMEGFGLPVRQAILASYLLLQEAELGTDAHDLTACLCLDLLLSKLKGEISCFLFFFFHYHYVVTIVHNR